MNFTNIQDGFGRQVQLNFESRLSKFGGLTPALHLLRQNGFIRLLEQNLVPTLPSERQTGKIKHSAESLFLQRFAGLLVGCEDLNDSPLLQNDSGFICALGKENLASTATLCRFERKVTKATIEKGNELLLDMWLRYGQRTRYIFIDVDNTPVELYGHQENVKFNGHYNCNCYLPLLAFIDGFPVGVFNGTIDGRKTMVASFGAMIDRIKKSRPNAIIILRADSGFNGKELIDFCERKNCYYIIGLSPNAALKKRLECWEPEFLDVLRRPPQVGGSLLRHYGEVEDYQAASWSGPRRVIARDYFDDQRREWDCRFIQTNIPKTNDGNCGKLFRYSSRELYEDLYCERGQVEKYNQEFKVQAKGARASSTLFLTNSYRMLLAAFCQMAYRLLRILYFKKNTPWNSAELSSFQRAFICAPAVVRTLKTKVIITINNASLSAEDLQRFWRFNSA